MEPSLPAPAGPQPSALPACPRIQPATWGWLVALLGWSLLVCFFHLHGGAGLEPVDAWVAQTAREMYENIARMAENADTDGWSWQPFIIPRFSGEVRMQKSPGAYWVAMLVAWLRGSPVDEVCVRIPNAAAAVLLVLTCFWLTRRIAGDRAAIFAGFATASSAFLLHFSRGGSADLPVAALMALSLACIWIGSEATPPGRRRVLLWLAGYFAAGLAMLYKMPMPLLCVGLPAFLYVLLLHRWRILTSPWHLLGLLLFCLPWLPWVLATVQIEPTALDKWRVEFLDRATGELPNVQDQTGWQYYLLYLGVAFIFALPYSLSIPGALVRPFLQRQDVRRDGMLFLWLWFIGLLAAFTAAAGKETRYLLPAMPPLMMLLGCELARFFDPDRPRNPTLARLGYLTALVLIPAGILAAAVALSWFARTWPDRIYYWQQARLPLAAAGAILLVGLLLAAVLTRRRPNAGFAALVATMWLLWLWAWPNLMPIVASQAPSKDFAAQLQTLAPEHRAALRQVAHQDPRIIWYSDVRFPRVVDPLEMLRIQGGRRSLEAEMHMVGQRMIELLESDALALFVAAPGDYILFHADAEAELRRRGRPMPRTYLWLVGRVGHDLRRYLLFGNQPPPWSPPELPATTRQLLENRRARLAASASAPTTTSRPADTE